MLLQKIINMTWQHTKGGTDKLSRWIRCLFSLALSETDIAVQLLDQAVAIAQEARKVCDSAPLTRRSGSPDAGTLVAPAAVRAVSSRRAGMARNKRLQPRN